MAIEIEPTKGDLLSQAAIETSQAEIALSKGDCASALGHLRAAFQLKREALGPVDPSIELTMDNLMQVFIVMQQMASWKCGHAPQVMPKNHGGFTCDPSH